MSKKNKQIQELIEAGEEIAKNLNMFLDVEFGEKFEDSECGERWLRAVKKVRE